MPHCVTKTRLQWAHIRTKDPRRFPAKLEDRVQALLQEQSARAKILRGSCAHDRPASAVAKPCKAQSRGELAETPNEEKPRQRGGGPVAKHRRPS